MSSKGYPADWNSRRKEVYQRDDYTCQNCGVRGGPKGNAELHAHHIVPKSKGGTHKKSNLKTLCKECHNAIHGDSMAPSINSTKQNTRLNYPVDIDRFPYTISEYIECMNAAAGIQTKFNKFFEISGDLVEYASACQKLDDDIPERVEHRYRDMKKEAMLILGDVQDNIESLREMDTSEIDSSTEEELNTFVAVANDLLTDIQEYLDLVDKMATADSFSESNYHDLQALKDEISETELDIIFSSLDNRFSSEVDEKINEMGNITLFGGLLTFPMKKCPVCESELQKEKISKDKTDSPFILLSCRGCKSEWASNGFTYTLTNNTEGNENISLAPSVWNKIRSSNQNIGDNSQQYKNKSAKVVRYKKYSTVVTFLLFIFLLLNYSFEPHIILLIITPLFGLMQISFAKMLQKVTVV